MRGIVNERVRYSEGCVCAGTDAPSDFGDVVYGSSGDFGAAFLTAIEIPTGKVLWQDRSRPLHLRGRRWQARPPRRDRRPRLALAAPEGLKVLAKAQVFGGRSWTVPSLAGTHLYLRDRTTIKALDLG